MSKEDGGGYPSDIEFNEPSVDLEVVEDCADLVESRQVLRNLGFQTHCTNDEAPTGFSQIRIGFRTEG